MNNEVNNIINQHIDDIFSELADKYMLDYGDISPDQQLALDNHINGIEKILVQYVNQNKNITV